MDALTLNRPPRYLEVTMSAPYTGEPVSPPAGMFWRVFRTGLRREAFEVQLRRTTYLGSRLVDDVWVFPDDYQWAHPADAIQAGKRNLLARRRDRLKAQLRRDSVKAMEGDSTR